MNILIVSQYFYPENFKVNDIAFDFVKKGHKVTVLTGIPNYPNGSFFKGYGFFKNRTQIINGVKILRVPLIPRYNGKNIFLAMNYISFLFFSFFAIHFRITEKYDVVFSHLPSPLISAIPGIWLKRKFKIPLVIWVLDLWPESVIANSKIKKGPIIYILKKIVRYIYHNSDKILVSSKSFKDSIKRKFEITDNKIEYLFNWAEDVFENDTNKIDYFNTDLPFGFNIVFAGNLGESQDFESILKAVDITKDKINWILVGNGRKVNWINKQKKLNNLCNLYLLGAYPLDSMPSLFKKADAMLVSLKDEPTFAMTIPAKIQAYMASAKIIIGMLNGEGNELINNNNCGYAVKASDYKGLAKLAIKICDLKTYEKHKIERTSFEFYNKNFSKKRMLNRLEEILKNEYIE